MHGGHPRSGRKPAGSTEKATRAFVLPEQLRDALRRGAALIAVESTPGYAVAPGESLRLDTAERPH